MDLPQPPPEELKNVIDKLAQFVARNGAEFEQMTKQKQKDNPSFAFLFGGPYFNYYQYRVTTEQAILRQRGPMMGVQVPPPVPAPSHSAGPSQAVIILQRQIEDAESKIRESHQNLSAQHEVLTKQQLSEQSLVRYRQLEVQHNDFVEHQRRQIQQWKAQLVATSLSMPVVSSATGPGSIMTSSGMVMSSPGQHPPSHLPNHPGLDQFGRLPQRPPIIPFQPLPLPTSVAISQSHMMPPGHYAPHQSSPGPMPQRSPFPGLPGSHAPSAARIGQPIAPGPVHHYPPMTGLVSPNTMPQQPSRMPFTPPQIKDGPPDVPYFDLPAGLMVPLVKLEDHEYKPIDPADIRLPAPTPPSDQLMKAVDSFYSPPSHDRPRNAEGWEQLGLYEFFKDKAAARKDVATNTSEKSADQKPSASTPAPIKTAAKSEAPAPASPKRRYKEDRSPQRRTRSRSSSSSRSSRSRSRSRSPSPHRSRHSRSSRKRSRSRSPRRIAPPPKRSPSPPAFIPFAQPQPTNTKLDSSNKGHRMLEKMGWRGAGLGSSEQGIQEPIAADPNRTDRQDQFRGVGASTGATDVYEAYRRNRGQQFMSRITGTRR